MIRCGVSMIVPVVLLASPALSGTVAISRESGLTSSGRTSLDQFELEDQSSDFGLYSNTLAQSVPGAGGGETQASASQRSEVDPLTNSGFVTGSMSAQVAELDAIAAQASNSFSFVFDVIDSPETLTLQGHVQSSFDAFTRVTVQQPATEPVFEEVLDVGRRIGWILTRRCC